MQKISTIFLFMIMLFLHIVDDFYLQGILAKLKQKSYWEQEAPDEKYKYDYIVALLIHAMSWAFMIMLPLFILSPADLDVMLFCVWLANVSIHAVVDDMKCNKLKINLIQDQITHLLQIIVTLLIFVL